MVIIFVLIYNFVFSQQQIDIPVQLFKEISKRTPVDKYTGSIYLFNDFKSGVVSFQGNKFEKMLNINTYSNTISFRNEFGEIFELNYSKDLSISIGDLKFKNLEINGEWFIAKEISQSGGDFLYKSFFTKLTPPKASSNGYDLPKPGKIEIKNHYIFFINDNFSIIKNSKKELLKRYREHAKFIKRYRFKKEEDWINFFFIK